MKDIYKADYLKLGLKIAYYRKIKGMTQEQLAEAIDCSAAFIGHVEAPNVYKAISLDTLYDISKVLDVPAYKFLMNDWKRNIHNKKEVTFNYRFFFICFTYKIVLKITFPPNS